MDERRNGQPVEAQCELLPDLQVVLALALVVEAVGSVHGAALVVAAQEVKLVWELDLVRQQQANGFDALLAAVHVVAEEQVLAAVLPRLTHHAEQAKQVDKLAVDVAEYLDGRLDFNQHRFLFEKDCCADDQELDLLLGQDFFLNYSVVVLDLFF